MLRDKAAYVLADFGLSRQTNRAYTAKVGSFRYMAPEVWGRKGEEGYTAKVDIYSLGMTSFDMLYPAA